MRYILGVFAVIVLLILIVVLILRIGPDEPASINQAGEKQVVLADYEDKAAVAQMTVRGKVVANEERRAIRISVSRNERVIEILQGYEEAVATRKTYGNNEEAYKVFLSALENAGYTREKETDIEDDRGVCPLGKRYIYKLIDGSDQIFRTWSTTCSLQSGSFGGNKSIVRKLFEQQIPDYRELTRNLAL